MIVIRDYLLKNYNEDGKWILGRLKLETLLSFGALLITLGLALGHNWIGSKYSSNAICCNEFEKVLTLWDSDGKDKAEEILSTLAPNERPWDFEPDDYDF